MMDLRVFGTTSSSFARTAAVLTLGGLAWTMGTAVEGCSSNEKLPPRARDVVGGDAGDEVDGGGGGPPEVDAGGYCGNEVHQAIIDAPNIYFVLDASGSMAEPVPQQPGDNRYDAVRIAIVDLVRNLGPLVNVGAAVFPGNTASDSCAAGGEVLAVTQGDPVTGVDGPTTTALRLSTIRNPIGGTPVSSTLEALTPILLALSGETYVVLATDGGPNCNEAAECSADACMLNIEGSCEPSGTNCCAPGSASGGPTFCVDSPATVAAIQALAVAGIHVNVVGIPGSELYAGVLDQMALAGGSQKASSPYYLKVGELGELAGVLSEIAKVAVKCEFTITDPPSEEGMTNVYLDNEVLPYNDPNGWYWKPPWIVTLVGDACDRLKAGQVKQVQIVSGCPTEMPK